MKSVLFRGPVLTQSGYGVHARQVARWLLSKNNIDVSFQVLPWGNTPWIVDPSRCNGLIGEVMKRTVSPSKKYDVTFQLQLPNEWDPSLGNFNIGMTAAVETDMCNPAWSINCNSMSHVIVPSEHARLNLVNTNQVKVPVSVVHESFSDACQKTSTEEIELSTPFNFLLFGQITGDNQFNDRKNTFNSLKWLFEEFKGNPDVGVVIKTNSGKNTLIDRNVTINVIKQVIGANRNSDFPKVHLVHGDMSDEQVVSIYRHSKIKALVAATRGEGFGLPILEAAACELPIIATSWSGHMDFLKLGKFIDINYTLQEVHKSRIDGQIFLPGMKWAEVNEKDFKKRVRKFYESPSTPKDWAVSLASKVNERFAFSNIATQYDKVISL